jgi:hypothetical protein
VGSRGSQTIHALSTALAALANLVTAAEGKADPSAPVRTRIGAHVIEDA